MVEKSDRKTVARPLACCVLTISDSRTLADDTSGAVLQEMLQADGHTIMEREIVKDDIYAVRAVVSRWITDPAIEVIITSGGTGFTGRDSTPEALEPLLDKKIPGFGELFRQISYLEIGTSTVQSRALGGMANATLIFALPGSTGACRTGWQKILTTQLDIDHKPCNFAELIPRFSER
jgi:molybdenum cofactor biosynthesis protein B